MNTYVHIWKHLAEIFLEGECFQMKVVEKIKTRFMLHKVFLKILPFMR
jgi:hypothetical protein